MQNQLNTRNRFSANLPLYGAVLILGIFTVWTLIPVATAFFGAGILYLLLRPIHKHLLKLTKRPTLAASAIIIISLLFIVLPIVYIGFLVASHAGEFVENTQALYQAISDFQLPQPYFRLVDSLNLNEMMTSVIGTGGTLAPGILVGFVGNIGHAVLVIFLMEVMLYFLMMDRDK
ncbi:AI-2E family transporter, partial [bacterium]|nr:AI-2E family transporter [bacterium]